MADRVSLGIFVQTVAGPAPEPTVLRVLPTVTFEERFEKEGRWLLGPRVLGSIIRHMRGKSLIANLDGPNRLLLALPNLPKVRDDIDGEYHDLFWSIPEELRLIYEECSLEVFDVLAEEVEQVAAEFIRAPAITQTINAANAMLRGFEDRRRAAGDPELWQILAERCGVPPWSIICMPKPFIDMREDNLS